MCKPMPVLIHKSISQIKHTQILCSISWGPEVTDWVFQFRIQRQIGTGQLGVHNIFFTTQNRTNTRTQFCCKNTQHSLTSLYLLWLFQNKVSRTKHHLWKLTPIFIHRVRSKIKHNQHLCSMSWWPDNVDWVRKFRNRRQIETSELRVN